MNNELHVIPLNDYREHTSNRHCWCNPIMDEEDNNLFVHNSMDRRELYEEGILRYN